jgi:hypothetical protein
MCQLGRSLGLMVSSPLDSKSTRPTLLSRSVLDWNWNWQTFLSKQTLNGSDEITGLLIFGEALSLFRCSKQYKITHRFWKLYLFSSSGEGVVCYMHIYIWTIYMCIYIFFFCIKSSNYSCALVFVEWHIVFENCICFLPQVKGWFAICIYIYIWTICICVYIHIYIFLHENLQIILVHWCS